MDVDSEVDENKSIPESVRKAKKRHIHAITQNTALVSIVSISIILTDTFNPLYPIRSLLSASAFFYRVQTRGAITFRVFSAYSFTQHQFLKRLSRHLPMLVYQSASHQFIMLLPCCQKKSSSTLLSPKMLSAVMIMMIPLLLKRSGIQKVGVLPEPVGEIIIQSSCLSCAMAS